MFVLVEVNVRKMSIFPSKYGNDEIGGAKPKNFGISMEVDSDLSLNEGKLTSLIGGCNADSAQVSQISDIYVLMLNQFIEIINFVFSFDKIGLPKNKSTDS